MQSHHWLQEKISHKVDKMGIAVALATLIGIALFAGGGIDNIVGEGSRSRSAQMPIEQASDTQKAHLLPYRDNEPNQQPGADSSHR